MKTKMQWSFALMAIVLISSCSESKIDPQIAQLDKEVNAIDSYLVSSGLAASEEIIYLTSGVRIQLDVIDNEAAPVKAGQKVVGTYQLYSFPDLILLDEGSLNDKIEDIVPSGLRGTLSGLMQGMTATVYLPSYHAFGTSGNSLVSPNSTVVYVVEVTDVVYTLAQQQQWESDSTEIADYLVENLIEAVYHETSGMWYQTVEPAGTGQIPSPYYDVDIDYTLWLLDDLETVIDEGTLSQYSIFGLIDGLKVGIPLMNQGTTMRFYIPSIMGYGEKGSGSIPPNTNLVFEVKLNNVYPN